MAKASSAFNTAADKKTGAAGDIDIAIAGDDTVVRGYDDGIVTGEAFFALRRAAETPGNSSP